MGKKKDEIRHLKELILLMESHQLMEIEIVEQGRKIRLQKMPPAPPPAPGVPAHQAVQASGGEAGDRSVQQADSGSKELKSPLVGTFYSGPSPDAGPFVSEGDHVEAGDVVCIVEAMKVMNELKSEWPGTVEKVLVENSQAVEYGDPLFLIRPD